MWLFQHADAVIALFSAIAGFIAGVKKPKTPRL